MLIKLLLVALAIFVLYKLFFNERNRKAKNEDKIRERKIASGEMVRDPACGTYVEVESSIKVRDGEKTYHFCSYDCRRKFLEELQSQGREIPQLESKDDKDEEEKQ